MAKKPSITTISSGYASTTTLNENFEALKEAFDNTLSRDGSTPNTMGADLDMNGNDIVGADRILVGGVDYLAQSLAHKNAAATSEANAATSEANAATSKTNAATSESNAATSATNASTSASSASTSASNASTSATTATTKATEAATSATNASTSETNAATSETNAATSETNAATSATNAATSATNAATSATSAATSATNAAASYDAFDDRYLGSKSTAPTTDNDGDALITGALYYNSTAEQLYVWNGSAWDQAAFSVSGAVTSFNTRTGAVTLSSSDVSGASGLLSTGGTMTGNLSLGDSVKAQFGASNDLSIYHDSVNSYIIDQGTGDLIINTNGNAISLNTNGGGHYGARVISNGAVELYHANNQKLATTSTGVSVTGDATFADNGKAIFGAGSDLQIYHDGSNSWIRDEGTGSLYIRGSTELALQSSAGDNYLQAISDGTTRLFYDHSEKFATTSTGVDVTGSVTADGLNVENTSGYGSLEVGGSSGGLVDFKAPFSDDFDSRIIANGTDFTLDNQNAGSIIFNNNAAERMRITSSGSVGIGTSSPSANLHVNGNAIAKTDTDTTNTGTVTLDFGANQNFVLTLTGNVTLANPTTEQVGQSGFIVFIQDATGGRTVSLGTDYETAGGAGLTLSSAASTTDLVPYIVAASGRILLGAPQLAFA